MNLKRVLTGDSQAFEDVWHIYHDSFLSDYRREKEQIIEALNNPSFTLFAAVANETIVGFMAVWDCGDFVVVEHFAVKKELRGHGLGTEMLTLFMKGMKKSVVMEVERPVNDEARRRIGFYERFGFVLNTYDYVQPPYNKEKKPLPLFLMTCPKPITSELEFLKTRRTMYGVIYRVTSL